MRNFILCLFGIFSSVIIFAQTETTTWKGETYYVYPHQSELLEKSSATFLLFAKKQEVLKRDDKNRNVIGKTIEPVNYEYAAFIEKDKKLRKLVELIKRLVTEKPNDLYSYEGILTNGITPALESIPDGKYVQFYKDVAYLDGQTIRYKNDLVAATFSVKNGVPDGLSVLYDVEGKEIARGSYSNGSRHDVWKSFIIKNDYSGGNENVEDYEELMSKMTVDTLTEVIYYSGGLKNGPYLYTVNGDTLITGAYKNDAESGSWVQKQYMIRKIGDSYEVSRELALKSRYSYPETPVTGKSLILRDEFVQSKFQEEYYYRQYATEEEGLEDADTTFSFPDDPVLYMEMIDFSTFYKINHGEEEDIELPDEEFNSFEGEEYGDEMYPEEMYEEGFSGYYGDEKQHMIDSLGYTFKYTGVYENYYANGQLQFRFEVRDGVLQKEEPVFWDNGVVASNVVFNADSNYYEVNYYDYKGKLYQQLRYDLKGKSIDTNTASESGYDYYEDEEDYNAPPGYSDKNELEIIENPEKLKAPLTEKRILLEKKWKEDQKTAFLKTYDPVTRTLESETTALSGKVINKDLVVFADDFRSVNGYEDYFIGPLKLHRQYNGSRSESDYFRDDQLESDSTLTDEQKYVSNWYYHFSLENDDVLFYNDQPFSGKYEIKLYQKKYKLKAGPSSVSFSIPELEVKTIGKASEKYWKKGKKSPLLDFVNSEIKTDIFNTMIFQLTRFANYDILTMAEKESYDYEEYGEYRDIAKDVPYVKVISGNMLNGKPHGLWTGKDQSGKVIVEITFENGEENGRLKVTKTAFAPTRKEIALMKKYSGPENNYGRDFGKDSPEKDTRYVAEVTTFKNGMFNGPRYDLGWKGDTLTYVVYRDGNKEGYSFERNKYIFAESYFENDEMDGIARTWLKLPGKDSVLLYDLNFQNGALQGESKAYHANGKLAKRGFFLYGQPIDDYEAFDTLGFKYQYVKFKYNQPVQEKIWEENQLSLRYDFDWRDSIGFNMQDIAQSPSIEELMFELGLAGDDYYEPYMGRPSLVDKTGIDYYMTKFYPNDTIAREGFISKGKKSACWKYYSYEGKLLYEVDYADTIIVLNDSIRFKSKGTLTFLDDKGLALSHSYIIEKFEKYDCSHTDHYEERMLYCFWEKDTATHRRNGYIVNYYDNGAKMGEGNVKDGLPTGIWKLYDNSGNLSKVGEYNLGKRQGRWLSGDLTNVKFLGDICLNPNLPNLEEIMKYQEKLIDITVTYYQNGKSLRTEYYGINMNPGDAPEGIYEGEDHYYGE